MFQITRYDSIIEPKIKEIISIDEYLNIIKKGDDNLGLIESARLYGKPHPKYDVIKTKLLPTYRFNFMFKDSASNENIIKPTGLIYLDVDDNKEINNNEYVYAYWKSLSNMGYGILVKVDNLTLNNFNDVYNQLSELIGIESDIYARKATQQTVQSYDKNLYHNPKSKVFKYIENKKVSHLNTLKKRKKCLDRDDTLLDKPISKDIRYNNMGDYFIDSDEPYIVFKDKKVLICAPYIPIRVEKGKRNSTLFIYFSQLAVLNNNISKNYLKVLSEGININVMRPRLPQKEINSIINSVLKKKEERTLKMFLNQERRIIFNPAYEMKFKQIMEIVNKELGQMTREKTKAIIYAIVEDWNFKSNGKITQKKVANISEKSIATVKRYWHYFKAYTRDLNRDYKLVDDDMDIEKKPSEIDQEASKNSSVIKYLNTGNISLNADGFTHL